MTTAAKQSRTAHSTNWRCSPRATHRLWLSVVCCGLAINVMATDVRYSVIYKTQRYLQTGSTSVALNSPNPFTFDVLVRLSAPGSLTGGTLRLPNGSLKSYTVTSSGLAARDYFATQAALDSAYANGGYNLFLSTVDDGNKSLPLTLSGSAYPNAPRVTNFDAAQTIDSASDFTLAWYPFAGGTANDYIRVQVFGTSGFVFQSGDVTYPGALDGTATSFVIPKNTLQTNQTYSVELFFAKTVQRDTTTYPGAQGGAGFAASTYFSIQTTVAPTAPVVINWSPPTDITYGTALSSSQLNATATASGVAIPGTFAYSPPAGTMLPTGQAQTLSVTFTPTDTLDYQGATATVQINVAPAQLAVFGLTAASKTYDGTTTATITGTPQLSGVVGSDAVSLNGTPTGAFASKTVGTGKPVAVTGLSVTGADAGNYILSAPSLTADITAAALAVTANDATRLVGGTNPPFTGTITGVQNGDNITANYSCIATTNSPAGTYPIVPVLVDPNGNLVNYSVTVTNGTLTVTGSTVAMSNPAVVGQTFSATIQSQAGVTYTLESTDDLGAANWASGQSVTATAGGPITLSDTNATVKARFYRVKVQF